MGKNSKFNEQRAKSIASKYCNNKGSEVGLVDSFALVCRFLADYPDSFSGRWKEKPSVFEDNGLEKLAKRYFDSYRKSDFPVVPGTVPDKMVTVVMQEAYGYSKADSERLKVDHQYAMCAENCVGSLLERYLDSVLRKYDWHWCCGDFIKAIDFISLGKDGKWLALQIKNRDNSENSSSSAIRKGTKIQKWFRSFSKKAETNWNNVPELMQGYSLSEAGFIAFVRRYLKHHKKQVNP